MTRGVSPALLAETLTHLQQENDHVKHPVRDRDCRHINGPGAAQTAQVAVHRVGLLFTNHDTILLQ